MVLLDVGVFLRGNAVGVAVAVVALLIGIGAVLVIALATGPDAVVMESCWLLVLRD